MTNPKMTDAKNPFAPNEGKTISLVIPNGIPHKINSFIYSTVPLGLIQMFINIEYSRIANNIGRIVLQTKSFVI